MKPIFKQILKYYLKYLTKLALFFHRPMIIIVSGNSNKYFIKEEIKKILLKKGFDVRANPKNFNTEIGLPLSILYLKSGYGCYTNWLPIILSAPRAVFSEFPKILVLELGTSAPGDMKYLLSIVKPDISIIYSITQRYLDGFPSLEKLIGEYEYLAKRTKNLLILNNDAELVKNLQIGANCKKIFFGLEKGGDWQVKNIKKNNKGQGFEVYLNNKKYKDIQINKFGEHHVCASLIGLIIDKQFLNYAE